MAAAAAASRTPLPRVLRALQVARSERERESGIHIRLYCNRKQNDKRYIDNTCSFVTSLSDTLKPAHVYQVNTKGPFYSLFSLYAFVAVVAMWTDAGLEFSR